MNVYEPNDGIDAVVAGLRTLTEIGRRLDD